MSASGGPSGFVARVFIVAGVAAAAALLWAWRDVFLLAFGAALIAIALHGVSDPIRKRTPLSNGAALAISVLVLAVVVFGSAWLFGREIVREITVFADRLPAAWAAFKARLAHDQIGALFVRELDAMASAKSGSLLSDYLSWLGAYGMSLVNAALEALLVICAAVFFAAEPATYRNGLIALFPAGARAPIAEAMSAGAEGLKRWLLGTLVSMVIVGASMTLGLWWLGVPAALALGIVTGLAQFVPLVGPLLSAAPAILLALTVSMETALWTAALHFTIMQTESNLLYPLIQQRAVSIPPALTLFAVLAMGLLFGPLGVLLATPLALVAIIFIKRLYLRDVLHQAEDAAS